MVFPFIDFLFLKSDALKATLATDAVIGTMVRPLMDNIWIWIALIF